MPHSPILLHGPALATLDACRREHDSVDLIYLDPPFFTRTVQRNVKSQRSFADTWSSMDDYLQWLRQHVTATHQTLSNSGVFCLHLDWHAVHYAKVLCDEIFGYDAFINEVIWHFRTGGVPKRALARKHDSILIYAKGKDYTFNPLKEKSYLAHHYGFSNIQIDEDERGKFRWAAMRDVWEIAAIRGNQGDASGWPTQKPIELPSRLIQLFTNPGDTVLDPMCGSGTTLVAASQLGRMAIGGDEQEDALSITRRRLAQLKQA